MAVEKGSGKIPDGITRDRSGLFRKEDQVFEPEMLDIDILRLLPDEGAMKGRYLQDILEVKHIRKALDPSLPSHLISFHLRVMWDEGLVVKVTTPHGRSDGWQRSAAGKRMATRGTIAESHESAPDD